MKIVEILRPAAVIELSSSTAPDVLAELCEPIAVGELGSKQLLERLLQREKQASTRVGDGVAIPHAKVAGLPALSASFGRSRTGVRFGDKLAEPTYLFFALFAPESTSVPHLRALARISRIVNSSYFRTSVMNARDSKEIYRLIESFDALN